MYLDYSKLIFLPIQYFYQDFAHAFYECVEFPNYFIQQIANSFHFKEALLERNHKLLERLAILEARERRFLGLHVENEQLRKLLQLTPHLPVRYLVAKVSQVDLNSFGQYLIVERGSHNGVHVGQAVMDARGIVGQVIEVNATFSKVMLLSDRQSAIPVYLPRNDLRGMVVGTGQQYGLEMLYMPIRADIRPGDVLLSSDMGGTYLAGYPVGRVSAVKRLQHETFARIWVQPYSLLHNNVHVLVLETSSGE